MRDTVTAISFDTAVMTFGVWVENRINEVDEYGNHPYSLEQLLGPNENVNNDQQFAALQTLLLSSRM